MNESISSKPCPPPQPGCPDKDTLIPCDCGNMILCSQARVSFCEAKLFCAAADRLICELNKAKNICEIKFVIEIINTLLKSSAEKELSLAEIIKAANMPEEIPYECTEST
jgi:hypothetical protein